MKKINRKSKIIIGLSAFILTFAFLITSIQGIFLADSLVDSVQVFGTPPTAKTQLSRILPVSAMSPSVSARSAILIDTVSGDTIFEVNSRTRLPMASTTKIMTAITAIESGVNLEQIVTITKKMTGAEGSSIYLYAGEKFVLLDLIYALMLNSANDSAEAIAICVAGSVDNFSVMMNDKAKELNLSDTNFTNPHGLDSELHYTTAYDLAKISAYALENELFYEISSTPSRVIYPLNADGSEHHEGARYLRNHNKMLRLYDGAIGVKTGFTRRSGRCLVSAAERDGTRLVAVTINAGDDWNDHTKMLNYGFDNYRNIELCKESEHKFEIHIVNGYRVNTSGKKEPVNMIQTHNIQDSFASLPKSIRREDIAYTIELPRFIYAPVSKGDTIGRIVFTHDELGVVGFSAIVSVEDVPADVREPSIISKIVDFFRG